MTLKKYYDALMAFDWDFKYRSDPADRERHRNQYATLQQLADKSEGHRKMFLAFVKYNTVLIRNPRLKPKRPI